MPTKNKTNSLSSDSSATATSPGRTFSHDEIAACAKAIWEEKGRPQGRDDEIWFEAQRRLRDGVKAKDIRAISDPEVPFNEDNEPTGRIESRLRRGAAQPRERSATSGTF